ncbi:hydantoinase B/oxoprolinase family protein [Streptomyces sp. NPDC057611]|uniref:hydantoinase B/oxoprolinase family protein n=1 Tax=Streptomyces sp. NPDC057611 TaxID=3346182 RepID=UPI003675BE40
MGAAPVELPGGGDVEDEDVADVRSRLVAITDQMRLALQSVSGSPTVTEASDFFTGIYRPDGAFVTMGHQVTGGTSGVWRTRGS